MHQASLADVRRSTHSICAVTSAKDAENGLLQSPTQSGYCLRNLPLLFCKVGGLLQVSTSLSMLAALASERGRVNPRFSYSFYCDRRYAGCDTAGARARARRSVDHAFAPAYFAPRPVVVKPVVASSGLLRVLIWLFRAG